jgi:hypothetical protein
MFGGTGRCTHDRPAGATIPPGCDLAVGASGDPGGQFAGRDDAAFASHRNPRS